MDDDLKSRLNREINDSFPVSDSAPDVSRIIDRGRRIRLQKSILTGSTVGALIIAIILLVPEFRAGVDPVRPSQTSGPQAQGVQSESAHAATFAVRAIAEAGLLDTTKILFDYQSTKAVEDQWVVRFETYDCTTNIEKGSCSRFGTGAAELTVSLEGGEWHVSETSAEVPQLAVTTLLAYTQVDVVEQPHMEFPSAQIAAHPDLIAFTGSPLWTGPIPAALGSAAVCTGKAFDQAGRVQFEGGPRTIEAPSTEEQRSGSFVPLRISSSLPNLALNEIFEVQIECRAAEIDGWEPVGTPILDIMEGAVEVTVTLNWSDPPLLSIFTSCRASVLDETGRVLGEKALTLMGPDEQTQSGPPFEQVVTFAIQISDVNDASSARVQCSPVDDPDV